MKNKKSKKENLIVVGVITVHMGLRTVLVFTLHVRKFNRKTLTEYTTTRARLWPQETHGFYIRIGWAVFNTAVEKQLSLQNTIFIYLIKIYQEFSLFPMSWPHQERYTISSFLLHCQHHHYPPCTSTVWFLRRQHMGSSTKTERSKVTSANAAKL